MMLRIFSSNYIVAAVAMMAMTTMTYNIHNNNGGVYAQDDVFDDISNAGIVNAARGLGLGDDGIRWDDSNDDDAFDLPPNERAKDTANAAIASGADAASTAMANGSDAASSAMASASDTIATAAGNAQDAASAAAASAADTAEEVTENQSDAVSDTIAKANTTATEAVTEAQATANEAVNNVVKVEVSSAALLTSSMMGMAAVTTAFVAMA